MSTRGYRVVYDKDVRRAVASRPLAGKQALAELLRELTRDAPLLEQQGAGPTGQEVGYTSTHDLLAAYRPDHESRMVELLSLIWLGAD